MSILNYLKANNTEINKKKGARKTIKKDMSIESMRGKIDSIIAQSYSYVGRTAFCPIISVEDIDTISELILGIERKLNMTIIPARLTTNSELCSAIQFIRYDLDDETYVAVLKQYINYLIEKNIPK